MDDTRDKPSGCEFVLVEHDEKQAIYETWVGLSVPSHGFHRYMLDSGDCNRIDTPRQTACDLSIATRIGGMITRAIEEEGELPERITREYW